MLAKKHPFTCCPAAKHQNAENLSVTNKREKPADYFYGTAWASSLAPKIITRT